MAKKVIQRSLFFLSTFVLMYADLCWPQTGPLSGPAQGLITVTGILLVNDWPCGESPNLPKEKSTCFEGSSSWGLLTLTKQYFVRGNTSELKKYMRHRVTVTGTASPGTNGTIDMFDVQSIEGSEITEAHIRDLIEELRHNSWDEPQNVSNPTIWLFNFNSPMLQILQAGPAAQSILLKYLDDSQIKDQIIILLGGVGDETAVGPIIDAMADRQEAHNSSYAKKVNLAANLALTNITVSDIIWHHGGGITRDKCPDDPKSCWSAWWRENKRTFKATKTWSRNYSNYPDYGIYQNPGMFRSESFQPK